MKICFIITSVINTAQTPLIYGPRSLYTWETRYNQVIETIESIRRYVPIATIYLLESSNMDPEYETKIKQLVDIYVNTSNIPELSPITNSVLKGYGEALQIIHSLSIMPIESMYDYTFKISGRYSLNETFDITKFTNNMNLITFCKGTTPDNDIVSTVLIGIPSSEINKVITGLKEAVKVFADYESANRISINTLPYYEKLFPRFMGTYNLIHHCGVQGQISSYNYLYKC